MNYIIIITLICINLFSFSLKSKKNNDEIKEAIKNHKKRYFYNIINKINIGIIIINIITLIISIVAGATDVIAHTIFLVGLILSYVYALTKKDKTEPKYNVMYKHDKYYPLLATNVIFATSLVDRVGHIKESNLGAFLSLFGIVFFILNIFVILKFLKENKSIIKYNAKETDIIKDTNYTTCIELKKIYSYILIGIIILLIIFINLLISPILYTLITILVLIIYSNDVNKINNEKTKLYNNVINLNQKPGTLYIYQYKKHIENTKSIILYIVLFIIALLTYYVVGEIEFLVLGMNLYIIVIYTLLNNKKKTIDSLYALNEDLIDKDKYKINLRNEITDVIEYTEILLANSFYKVIYKDENNNIYISEKILYNLKSIETDINIYINTTDMYDYIVVEDSYY